MRKNSYWFGWEVFINRVINKCNKFCYMLVMWLYCLFLFFLLIINEVWFFYKRFEVDCVIFMGRYYFGCKFNE